MIHDDKDEVNQEFDYKDLKASVSKQQTEISRLKELIEDIKSDFSITSHANHIETKKLFERILHAVEANGNGKVTTTNVTTNTIFNEAMH
ncbi:hypothetical protein TrispH2_005811 [Trichoplax sp. H2]|nr:hypothetical protein TrispH2_005811 [Trichoplax sp. H2]|eukprot:RDD41929.1 hypothetical protein TrispH2_005811 [Trichoplax sp. H2]